MQCICEKHEYTTTDYRATYISVTYFKIIERFITLVGI